MILGPISKLLGYIMEGIFFVLDKIGIPNIGLAIILFTIVMYLLLMPLTIRQQKFSKLSAKMNPEIQAIQAKYKGKKDNDSTMAMNQETQAVYAKYGVSPTGSCVQLLIQMPILFALYRVINNIPAYVGQVRDAFIPLVDKLRDITGSADFLQTFTQAAQYTKQFTNEAYTSGNIDYVTNTYIDVLNKASTTEFLSLAEKFPSVATEVTGTMELLNRYNNFLGINISNSPSYMVKEAMAIISDSAIATPASAYLMIIGALAIPVLSALSQFISVKLMPQATDNSAANDGNTMAQSMKTMNMMMPIMSAFFCYTLPAGMGLYWIAGAVVRTVQQVLINKHIDKMDLDAEIKKNVEKRNKKLAKAGVDPSKLNNYASMNTRSVSNTNASKIANNTSANVKKDNTMTQEQKDEAMKKATDYYNKGGAKSGSIASKANMVKQYNEKNNK